MLAFKTKSKYWFTFNNSINPTLVARNPRCQEPGVFTITRVRSQNDVYNGVS